MDLSNNTLLDLYNEVLSHQNIVSSYYNKNFSTTFYGIIYNDTSLYQVMTDISDTFSAWFDNIAPAILDKNNPLRLYEILPAHIHKSTIENLDAWYLAGETNMIHTSSIPDTKLYYPEPFVASPSFVHEEVWFLHILHYNYWLWFFFISLIMFYFITFITVVRWCNIRIKPKRETRGVSRSKCADLITACVPVSWAASIIISETVDATDYYDGFGTGGIVIGIRAYQWGWEYFYPKNIDCNYNLKMTYSSMLGNSLKYSTTSSNISDSNKLWKYYKNKNNKINSNTPGYLLLSPSDNSNVLNNIDFTNVSNSITPDFTCFKNIKISSKLASNLILVISYNNTLKFFNLN